MSRNYTEVTKPVRVNLPTNETEKREQRWIGRQIRKVGQGIIRIPSRVANYTSNKISDGAHKTLYNTNDCYRAAINQRWVDHLSQREQDTANQELLNEALQEAGVEPLKEKPARAPNISLTEKNRGALRWSDANLTPETRTAIYEKCNQRNQTSNTVVQSVNLPGTTTDDFIPPNLGGPFDSRLQRLFQSRSFNPDTDYNSGNLINPYSMRFSQTATSGYYISEKRLTEENAPKRVIEAVRAAREAMKNELYYTGTPSLINSYSLTRLYGAEGGELLVNKKDKRRWYEVDIEVNGVVAYSMNPTTYSLITWGNADPHGRLPYAFSDFTFCKWWKKIENNRLITLRRYGAPILDNLKFPGMEGQTTTIGGTDQSQPLVEFPPMATAVTYFGEETGNSLTKILKFSTGLPWEDAEGNVFEVATETTPDADAGPGGVEGGLTGRLFGGLKSISNMLNVGGGNIDTETLMNKGKLPPDPYTNGPYENRILGPVNRISKVKKRKAGLDFDMGGLQLNFEYVARPFGGINTKAVILDILSNFLVMGSASAMFFGGQHRFMADPGKYPFIGGDKGIEAWYSGKPIQFANATLTSFTSTVTNPDGGWMKSIKDFMGNLLGGSPKDALGSLFSEGNIGSNFVKQQMAEKSGGQIPYLKGLKALLTGEPVGEWHITVGNPLNPIAMIGNLICSKVEVEFGEELGPDDFPTEIKFTVSLDHGMGRDRDAIQSMFNRGMGRIYELPDGFEGTADGQTAVDDYTRDSNKMGTPLRSRGWFAGPSTVGSKAGPPSVAEIVNSGTTSVWTPLTFSSITPNAVVSEDLFLQSRSAFRGVDWIANRSLT